MPELHTVTIHDALNPSVRSVRVTEAQLIEPIVLAAYDAGFVLIVVNDAGAPVRAYRRTDR